MEFEREYQKLKKSPLCSFVESIFFYDANAFMYCEYSTFFDTNELCSIRMSSINKDNFLKFYLLFTHVEIVIV